MKIINKYDTLIQYFIDLQYFDWHTQVSKICSTSSNWMPGEENTYMLTHDTFYKAKGLSSDNIVLNYHRWLELHCMFEDIEKDAVEILKLEEKANI